MYNFVKIKLQGGYYKDCEELKLFNSETNNASIIYGANGSGKSCIASAFRELAFDLETEKIYSINKLFDSHESEIVLTEQESSAISVFDEEYIDKNVKLDQDSLGAIIMLGEQSQYDEQINKLKENLKTIKTEKKLIDLNKFEGEKSTNSVNKKKKNILDSLKNGWAAREKDIRDSPRNASVTDNLFEEIMNMQLPKDSKTQLSQSLSDLTDTINNARSNSEKIFIDTINLNKINEKELIQLLMTRVDKPGKNKLEERILDTVEQKGKEFIEYSIDDFSDSSTEYCPYCYQNISDDYKKSLTAAISKIFSDEVEKHSESLFSSKIDTIIINVEQARKIDNVFVDRFDDILQQCNLAIEKYNQYLDKKISNVFDPIVIDSIGLDELLNKLDEIYHGIAIKIKDFNRSIDEINLNIQKAQEINKNIAKIETKSLFTEYESTKNDYQKSKSELEKLITTESGIEQEIIVLNAKKNSVDIALELINEYLALIFGDVKRLKLTLSNNNNYYVESKNRKVKLKNLSVGERNAIALCYFFSQIQKEASINSSFNKEFLLILDDPVSSFDFDNKIGIYSFLKMILTRVLVGNTNSKVLLLTHEIEVAINLNKVFVDIKKTNSSIFESSFHCTRRIMADKSIIDMNIDKFNSYYRLLDDIYNYSTSPDTQDKLDYTIGNTIRKALEAFATFQFRCGLDDLYRNDTITSLITNEKQKTYFTSRMSRIVMHGESHTEDNIKNIVNRSTLEYYSTVEKIQVAKDVLAFIYLLYSKHIESYFKDNQVAIRNIILWSQAPIHN